MVEPIAAGTGKLEVEPGRFQHVGTRGAHVVISHVSSIMLEYAQPMKLHLQSLVDSHYRFTFGSRFYVITTE